MRFVAEVSPLETHLRHQGAVLHAAVEKDGRDIHVYIVSDDQPEDPREWDNLGRMICWHRRYRLGDRHNFTVAEFEEFMDENPGVYLPLYIFDHGLITMQTYPFEGPDAYWDSGQVGWIYVTDEDIEKEYGAVNKETREKARQALKAEVETYDQYLRGEVYGYIIVERKPVIGDIYDEVHLDSCWGFFGDPRHNGMMDYIRASLGMPELQFDQFEELY